MRRIVTGGTGLIGKRLVEQWLSQNHEVTVIGRTIAHIEEVFDKRVKAVTWEEVKPELFAGAQAVVNLTGASIGTVRWTDARKKEVIQSRIEPTKKIAESLATLGKAAPLLLNASAIGIYGLQQQLPDSLPVHFDESTGIAWENPPDFLSSVATQWELAAKPAMDSGVRVIFLRFGVVLAKEGGALKQLTLPYQFFLGGPIGTGHQPFCWIAIDDVIRVIDFLIESPNVSGPINVVSPECITQQKLAETISQVMRRPILISMPAFAIKLLLGEQMAHELLLEGQNVYPKKLIDLKYHFSYPTIEAALKHILE